MRLLSLLLLCLLSSWSSSAQMMVKNDLEQQFHGLQWRNIGPQRGGRANAIAGVIGNDQLYYAGYTGGGVWKTTDAGYTWENLSDGYLTTGSIGDIAVCETDPNLIYVGSGEHAVRGVMTSYGTGVYKSTDAGKSWRLMGLEGTRHISDVIIDPRNVETVFVGAQGPVHGPSADRGVYKSTDGGETWQKTLYIDEHTGISSLVMDMTNPRILYAATWQHRRYPWKVESGGPGSGIYKSMDGGETWQKLVEGLPDTLGKIGLSVSRANPDRVFAIIETEKEKSGLYRSDDGGMHWNLLSTDQLITARSWYYMEVFADPSNADVVYVLNAPLMRSIDGGKTFESLRVVHGDCHDLWINPDNSNNLAMAEDGGGTISFSRGRVWSDLDNQPTGQFYRITADYQQPFWVYSGQQDNLSVAIPSRNNNYGIISTDWFNGPGCESAMVAFDDPYDPKILYGGCFNGRISLLDVRTMEAKDIQPYPMTNLGYQAKDMKYRFNWNAPLINSAHDPKTMYYGGNVVFKTTDGALSWEVISPDLTRDDTTRQAAGGGPFTNEGAGGENYNTVYYLAESPHQEGVLYAGTDCGLLQLTRDGGATWENITPPALPETMIHAIEVSPHDPGTVYFCSTRYKFNDFKNYSYKSTDYGKSWEEIGTDIQEDDFFRVVREDPKVPGLLYAGAERGFYISNDGGRHFTRFQQNLPIVPVTDLVIRHNDLAASTAGRGFWILDDLSALQQSRAEWDEEAEVKLFTPKAQPRLLGSSAFYLVTELAYGENPTEGVVLDYYLDDQGHDSLKLEILDAEGQVIRTLTNNEKFEPRMQGTRGHIPAANTEHLPDQPGINRFTWDFRTDGLTRIPETFVLGADYRGHRIAPGTYTARLTRGAATSEATIVIQPPPGPEIPENLWHEQQRLLERIESRIDEIHKSINRTMEMSAQLENLKKMIADYPEHDELQQEAKALEKQIADWRSVVIELRQKGFQDALNWPAGMNAEFFLLKTNLDTYDPAIPEGYRERFQDLESTWLEHQQKFDRMMANEVKAFNEAFGRASLPILPVPEEPVSKP